MTSLSPTRYGVEDLKVVCEQHLKQNLQVDSVWDVLSLARERGLHSLVSICQKIVASNTAEVIQSAAYLDHRQRDVEMAVIQLEECLVSPEGKKSSNE